MGVEIYTQSLENQKCQCITFDEHGRVLGSNDALFPAVRLTLERMKKEMPFVWKVLRHLKSEDAETDPLFFPEVEFEVNGYRNICDFTFMKSVDPMGIRRFICLIYDNSIHYRHLLSSGKVKKCRVSI